jgi:alkyl hydroperoxide reductase subunit AhpC
MSGKFEEQEAGARRSLFIIDPKGIVRHKEEHQGTLPDPQTILEMVTSLKAGG